ncbi:hypothetical protein TCAL_08889 [Tigriopus californicus]|uniref:NAD(P)-binding domain-containing protein n=1 Tax=Tigriopus californicus TaxID=6832 RepID=A0A553NT81_TIGCA|nr:uncharacterized protein LOC131890104 [Tigriopus californicus]TRY68641.1 hypothetical protein TCAL_08889 [Tigriopus californicus]
MSSKSKNLVIVGAGHLGCRVAQLWRESYPEARIVLKTRSFNEKRATLWSSLGYIPVSSKDPGEAEKSDCVIFCAPPTGNDNYPDDVHQALQDHWTGSAQGGFVFTSSGGVLAENGGGVVNEASEIKHSPYNDKILEAEKHTLDNEGCVIRLGGLYEQNRGAHNYWLTVKDAYPSAPNGLINLIHYQDAALCVIRILERQIRSRLFLASDGQPISRSGICQAARLNPDYSDKSLPRFEGQEDLIDGKKYVTARLQSELDWKPLFPDFKTFMADMYQNVQPCDLLAGLK